VDAKLKISNQPGDKIGSDVLQPEPDADRLETENDRGAGEIDADELKRDEVQGRRTRKNTNAFFGFSLVAPRSSAR
jgi:hypothetical protein